MRSSYGSTYSIHGGIRAIRHRGCQLRRSGHSQQLVGRTDCSFLRDCDVLVQEAFTATKPHHGAKRQISLIIACHTKLYQRILGLLEQTSHRPVDHSRSTSTNQQHETAAFSVFSSEFYLVVVQLSVTDGALARSKHGAASIPNLSKIRKHT